MAIRQRAERSIAELLREVYEAPDFSFLQGWPKDSSFFPRLNGAAPVALELKEGKREELRAAIGAVRKLDPLLAEAGAELRSSGGSLSNSISVFHRDGDVSVVAIPVTPETRRSLGGFLFARELEAGGDADRFFAELKDLDILAQGAERALAFRKRWWRKEGEDQLVDLRRSAQLLLAAKATGPAQLDRIVDSLAERISMASGSELPSVSDWQQALLKLEALKDLPEDAVVSTIEITGVSELTSALRSIGEGFERLDGRKRALASDLEVLKTAKIKAHTEGYSLDDFARRVKGRGFARKALNDLALRERKIQSSTAVSIGEVLELGKNSRKLFRTSSMVSSLETLEEYFEDRKNLLGYPRLTDSGPAFDHFLVSAHELYLEQQRPYPARAQFDVLRKLLRDSPQELHLVGRNSSAIQKLIGSVNIYSDGSRLAKLSAEAEFSSVAEARDFFSTNPASFQSVLSNLGFNALSLEQISGFLAPELTSKIRNIDLDLAGMRSQLRSYQLFGAQYALHQRRVILGDEMGLGKTVTALALAKHLTNEGGERVLVVLPQAVLENWRREVLKHTDYAPRVLHGETLTADLALWVSEGGVALATYESIQRVNQQHVLEDLKSISLTVVDEAHFLKNPKTKRTQAVLPWIRSSGHSLLMTGTPLENSLDEFINLISYVQPQLELPEDLTAYSLFRKAIAPVYLRRNQVDVLQEIPEIQEEEDFVELSEADAEYYRRALSQNDWHLSRRARVLSGEKSSTVQRIQSLVAEAMENGHKVLIFSFYLETIEVLQRCLREDDGFLPLTGALNSAQRQAEVDKFTESKDPAVLLAQTTAGGTGLNIQAATMVIIVEPQSKPSLESQIIGRAHRMGQTKAVRVIRLRGKNTVDERWVAMLEEKRKIFAATAGISDAAALDGAMDSSSTSKEIMEAERKAWGL